MATYKPVIMAVPPASRMQLYAFPDGNNGGMNMRMQADQIRSDQSPDMLNMCYREGVPSHRLGFNTEHEIGDSSSPVRGMHMGSMENADYFLAVCDGKLIVID